MKRPIISIVTALAAVLLLAASCCSVTKQTISPLQIDGDWKISKVNGETVKADDNQLTMIFSVAKGRVGGMGICNSYGGSFTLAEDGICTVEGIMSTRVGCEGNALEATIASALEGAKKVVVSKKKAFLYDNAEAKGTPLFELTR